MLQRLAKLASRSAALREAALTKQAGPLGWAGRQVLKHPVATGFAGLGGVMGAKAAKGKYDQFKSGFEPAAQRAMLGQTPTPPGVG